MPHPTTQHRSGTDGDERAGGRGAATHRRGLASMVSGALGVVMAILPALGIVALALAALALGAGVPVMRRGPAAAGFPFARTGVVLGMIAVLLGFVSLAMQLLS